MQHPALCTLLAAVWISVSSSATEPASVSPREGGTLVVAGRTATIRQLNDLPYVESEFTQRFKFDASDNPKLKALRQDYQLDSVVALGGTEFEQQLLLLDWAHHQFRKFGRPSKDARGALDILQAIQEGHTFHCAHYAQLFVSAAASLGWIDRELALRRHQDSPGGGSTEHSTTEIWSNQYRKWVMLDPTANMHITKDDVPLNAFEIRQEWFHHGGTNLVFVIGKAGKRYRKSELPIYLGHFAGFGDLTVPVDELDKYGFIGYIPNTDLMDSGLDYAQMFITQDELCAGTRWHRRPNPPNPAVDPYFPLDQVSITLFAEQEKVRVALRTMTPNFHHYEASMGGGTWQPTEGSILWVLQPGSNRLELKTVNAFGRAGPISTVVLDW